MTSIQNITLVASFQLHYPSLTKAEYILCGYS